jgi:hypothetical protein
MNKVPNFRVETSNGQVALIFQTKANQAIIAFIGNKIVMTIDGIIVFETAN